MLVDSSSGGGEKAEGLIPETTVAENTSIELLKTLFKEQTMTKKLLVR